MSLCFAPRGVVPEPPHCGAAESVSANPFQRSAARFFRLLEAVDPHFLKCVCKHVPKFQILSIVTAITNHILYMSDDACVRCRKTVVPGVKPFYFP